MIPAWQISRQGLFWLLLAFVAVIMMHADHLPRWVLAASVVAVVWRIQCYRGAWSVPGRWLKMTLLAVCVGGLLLEYGQPIGLEPMLALLVTAYMLKLLEMSHRRDAYLVVLLAFFVAALTALFDQSMVSAGYLLGCLLLVLAALVGLHHGDQPGGTLRPLKVAISLVCQALPLMVVLFLLMPRIGALWSVPIPTHKAKTGVTGSMSPGDFSQLGRSAELAFRVSFDGPIPPQRALYWRGLVLSDFDGRTWKRTRRYSLEDGALLQWYGQPEKHWDAFIDRRGQAVNFSVVMEPTWQPWLYALATPLPRDMNIALTRDYGLVAGQPVTSKKQYRVSSWLDYRIEMRGLARDRRAIELQLPKGYNPRAVELAREWRAKASSDRAFIQRVLGLFNREFIYMLQPPLLGQHSVDEFLFESKQGFCEHFAGSFVFLMRAAGIPARVLAGYQGGERHPDGYLLVRQYDAHAWTEVWLENEGWVSIDPTASVAPERIEGDVQSLLGSEDGFLADSPASLVRFRHIGWINRLRLEMEALNYHWALWVLGYDQMQSSVLTRLLGEISVWRIAIALLGTGGAVLLLIALWQWIPSRRPATNPIDRQFILLCEHLEKQGIERKPGEGVRAFTQRAASLRPEMAELLRSFCEQFESMRYGGETPQDILLEEKLRALRRAK